jgi:DNA-directed RNA polymerase alpha subunit
MSAHSVAELIAASGRPLTTPLDELGLPWQTIKPLIADGLNTLGRLAGRTDAELLMVDGVGAGRLQTLKDAITGVAS